MEGGTVTHLPPESWQDIDAIPTETWDIYALGILMWQLFTEQTPYRGKQNHHRTLPNK